MKHIHSHSEQTNKSHIKAKHRNPLWESVFFHI